MKFTYLLVNLFAVIIPIAFSFHPKLQFYRTWKAFIPAIFITGICFLFWDSYFVSLGIWGFNPQYITGIKVRNLPIEEVLFFFCIPYACIFTFHCLSGLVALSERKISVHRLTTILISVLTIVGVVFYERMYTIATFLVLAALLSTMQFVLRINWLRQFYFTFAILLIPFLVVNGILTGTGLKAPVVWYNNEETMGFRILTIPVEDVFYGMALILMNISIYRFFLSKYKNQLYPFQS